MEQEQQTEPITNVVYDNIGPEFAADFALAQAEIEGADKDSENPHFKSKYADLASVWRACRKALTSHGFSVIQMPHGTGADAVVTTMLLHKSGQRISSTLTLFGKDASPQAVCGAITYARRYALSAMAGVAPEDDDGETAQSAWKKGKDAQAEVATNKITALSGKNTPPAGKTTGKETPVITACQTKDEFLLALSVLLTHFPKLTKDQRKAQWQLAAIALNKLTGNNKEYQSVLANYGNSLAKDGKGERHASEFGSTPEDLRVEMFALEEMWKVWWDISMAQVQEYRG